MTKPISLSALVACLALACIGCGSSSDFDGGKAKGIIESAPVSLDAEQVSLTPPQLDCGVQSDLWESPTQVSADRTSARLTQQGRDLKFEDEVTMEAGYNKPHVQLRGAIPLQVDEVSAIRNGDDASTKLVDAKVSAKIQHACFQTPLPVLGVRKGKFKEDTPVSFQFVMKEDGWHLDKIVH